MHRHQIGHNPAVWEHRAPRGEWDVILRAMREQHDPHTRTIEWLDLLVHYRLDHDSIRLVTGNPGAMAISNAIRDLGGTWDS